VLILKKICIVSLLDDPQQVIDYYASNPQLKSGVEASVLEDMVVELILEKATVTEKTVSYEEAVKTESA